MEYKIMATISADIVKSTSLSKGGIIVLREELETFLDDMRKRFNGVWGRVIRGDSLECVVPDLNKLLRIVLLLQCYVKAIKVKLKAQRIDVIDKKFAKFGVRIAVAIDELRTSDEGNGIIDGAAIYASGRALSNLRDWEKDVFTISSIYGGTIAIVRALFLLTHKMIIRATSRQCQVLSYRLLGYEEEDIAKRLGITSIAVYQHLQIVGWEAINAALKCYETLDLAKDLRIGG